MALFVLRAFLALCLVSSVSACSCLYTPFVLQDIYCYANYVIQFTVTGSDELRVGANYLFGGDERYIITTPVVYKSSSAYNAVVDKNSLYTALSGSMCGAYLEEGTTYIISGFIWNGQLRITSCSPMLKHLEEFTADQLTKLTFGEFNDHC